VIELLNKSNQPTMIPGSKVRILFGAGAVDRLGPMVRELSGGRVLLVSDPGIRAAGHVERAIRSIYHAGLVVRIFDEAEENPTTITVDKGLRIARKFNPDLIVGLGGGSSMDTAKGINFLLTNGGRMQDYWGTEKATKPMLPLIAIPTTSGTGSEAQSYALISDPDTHTKMACGDSKALPRLAILDPELTVTQPFRVAAATGIDAITHAVETSGSMRRNDVSRGLSKEAWRLLESSFEHSLTLSPHLPISSSLKNARANMLLGAHLAGCAIQNSMLGAAHATANPLTAKFGITHGIAVGLMLPHVVRFNCEEGTNPYSDLTNSPGELMNQLNHFLDVVKFPRRLRDLGVPETSLPELASLASKQWTATFNPRPVGEKELLAIYRLAIG
jgi:alcohol dehydrogenase